MADNQDTIKRTIGIGDLVVNRSTGLTAGEKQREITKDGSLLWGTTCVKDIIVSPIDGHSNASYKLIEYFFQDSAYVVDKFEERIKKIWPNIEFKYDIILEKHDNTFIEAHSDKLNTIVKDGIKNIGFISLYSK